MSKPLILITNDDGIFSPGIAALVEISKEIGEVVVVAPDSPQSGQGHSISLYKPIRLKNVNVFEGIVSYECSGTPVDAVKLAKNEILKDRKIDLCVSGINHGSNNSINVLYSGTMSAAMEASLSNIPSIGFSLMDFSFKADFTAAKHYAKKMMQTVLENGMGNAKLLNVNIPKLGIDEIKGIKVCRQSKGTWVEEFQQGTDPRGQKYFWLAGHFRNDDEGEDHDIWALKNGYVSVVPCIEDLTDYDNLIDIKQSFGQL